MAMNSLYDIFDPLPPGCFAPVYSGNDRASGDRPVRIIALAESLLGPRLDSVWSSILVPLRISHRHVVSSLPPVREFGWIVTETADGHLGNYQAAQPLSAEQLLTLLRQMLEALEQYHALNLVHGGVCPASFLVTQKGFAKLDYSPGLLIDGEVTARIAHHEFTPPETINPELGPIGVAADFYSLGMSLAALACGPKFSSQFPVDDQTPETLQSSWLSWHARKQDSLASVGVLERLPKELRDLVARMTAKLVSERPQSARQILESLAKHQDVKIAVPSPSPAAEVGAAVMVEREEIRQPYHQPHSGSAEPRSNRQVAGATGVPGPTSGGEPASSWRRFAVPGSLIVLLSIVILGIIFWQFGRTSDVPGTADTTDEQTSDANATNDSVAGTEKETSPVDSSAKTLDPISSDSKMASEDITLSFGERFNGRIQVMQGDQIVPVKNRTWMVKPQVPIKVTGAGYVPSEFELKVSDVASYQLTPILPEGYQARRGTSTDPYTGLPCEIELIALADSGMPLVLRLVGSDVTGSFTVGRTGGVMPQELPARQVPLERPFYLSVTEITNFQMDFMKYEIDQIGPQRPVPKSEEDRDWGPSRFALFSVIQDVCSRYFQGRLPTELEWELAACGPAGPGDEGRIGLPALQFAKLKMEQPTDIDALNAYLRIDHYRDNLVYTPFSQRGNATDETIDALQGRDFSPHYGICDMAGNVSEWCLTEDGQPIIRGGNFSSFELANGFRITNRITPEIEAGSGEVRYGVGVTGFRVVVDVAVELAN
jgi:serine/threonine protein kinase